MKDRAYWCRLCAVWHPVLCTENKKHVDVLTALFAEMRRTMEISLRVGEPAITHFRVRHDIVAMLPPNAICRANGVSVRFGNEFRRSEDAERFEFR